MAQFLRPIRWLVQRALHPWRRAKAVARLRRPPFLQRILVICHGNICRSPFAAAALARTLGPIGIEVRSAGLIGPGRPSPAAAIARARARDIDLVGHRSQLVSPQMVRWADLVIVMDASQRAVVLYDLPGRRDSILLLGDLDPGPFPGRAITDPWDGEEGVFDEVYARIERCVDEFGRSLGVVRPGRPRTREPSSPARRPLSAPVPGPSR